MTKLKNNSNEIVLEKDNKFTTKYGVKNQNGKNNIFYLRTKAKITPIISKQTYEDDVLTIRNKFEEFISRFVSNNKYIENNYLSNIDISAKSISFGKVSFLRYDLYFKTITKNTLEKNELFFKKISEKVDNFLVKTLHKHNIECC